MLRTLLVLILALTVAIPVGDAQVVNRPVGANAVAAPGTSAPSTCAVGGLFFKSNATAGQNLQLCTAANTWTGIADGSGAGSFTTLSATGLITKTNTTADTLWLQSSSTGTGANYFRLVSTGGTYEQGIENSTASLYGATAYDYFQAVPTGKGYSIFVGGTGVVSRFTATGSVLTGTTTNDAAGAGKIGELLTTTVASGSAVSLTTATSANIATLSVTAGDWDCSAQVVHNAAATTSVTLLQIGISATTATLPTQAGGSGIGTDPLAIFRQAAAVPGGALTTNVGPVRVSLSGTTNIFLVANDTFTVSTMTGYGTIRCRRMR